MQNSAPEKPDDGMSKVIFINPSPCSATVQHNDYIKVIPSLETTEYLSVPSGDKRFNITWDQTCPSEFRNEQVSYGLQSKTAYQLLTLGYIPGTNSTLLTEQKLLDLTSDSTSTFRVFNGLQYPVSIRFQATKDQEKDKHLYNVSSYTFSDPVKLVIAEFNVYVKNGLTDSDEHKLSEKLVATNGAIYNVLLSDFTSHSSSTDNVTMVRLTDAAPWSINIFLQVPQYAVLSFGECLFSITGLAFAYTQAPASMKSLLTAAWLLTIAVGDLVIIIVSEAASESTDQSIIFFVFAGVLFAVTFVFVIMGWFYKYVEPSPVDEKGDRKSSESSLSSSDQSDNVNEEHGLPPYAEKATYVNNLTPLSLLCKAKPVATPTPPNVDDDAKPTKTLTWSDKPSGGSGGYENSTFNSDYEPESTQF